MRAYLLASLALLAALANKSWAPILRATVGGALGLGLAAVYWLPAALERNWVDVRQATQDPGYNFENNWLFIHNANPALALHDAINHQASWIAVSMLVVAIIAFVVAWRRGTLPSPANSPRWWSRSPPSPSESRFFASPSHHFVWHALPEMPFVQYPWRWLEAVEAPMAIFFVAAIWTAARRCAYHGYHRLRVRLHRRTCLRQSQLLPSLLPRRRCARNARVVSPRRGV